jgi:uncharacterized lipoprotein YmbA
MRCLAGRLTRYAIVITMTLMVFGCKGHTPPTNFYTLTPISVTQDLNSEGAAFKDFQIGIGPVAFPKVLDRPQIVTRPAPGRLEMAEFRRWGGYFKDDFLSVLASNISTLLGTDQVFVFPWPGSLKPSYQIEIEVYRFDGKLGDSVVLNVGWILKTSDPDQAVSLKRSTIVQPVTGDDYDALVAAKNGALEKFSHMILDELKKAM